MKIMFIGSRQYYEPDMPQRIQNALLQLFRQEKQLEFYFCGRSQLLAECRFQTAIFKARHSKASISLINVLSHYDAAATPEEKSLQSTDGPFDQTLILPTPKKIIPETPQAHLQQFYQAQRQTADLCDCFICCNYFALYDPANTLVRRQMKKSTAQIITLANPFTSVWISEQYSQLPERQCLIMNQLYEGKSLSSIARMMNISDERVRQMAARATHALTMMLKTRLREIQQTDSEASPL